MVISTTDIEVTIESTEQVRIGAVGHSTNLAYGKTKWQGVTAEQFHGALKRVSRSTRGMSSVESTHPADDVQDLGRISGGSWERKRRK